MPKVETPKRYSEKLGFGRGFGTDGEYVVNEDGKKLRMLTKEEKLILTGMAGYLEDIDQAKKQLLIAEARYKEFLNTPIGELDEN